jgi:STE24 endopeptidase
LSARTQPRVLQRFRDLLAGPRKSRSTTGRGRACDTISNTMRSLLTLLCVAFSLVAQTATPRPALQIPAGAEAGPGFDAEAATKAYLATWKPDQKARSDAYFEGGYWLQLWDLLIAAGISILLLATRLSAKFRDWSQRIASPQPLVTWLYWAQYSLAIFIVGFPWAVYEGFLRESQYGFMNQTFAAWFVDQCKSLAIDILLGGLAVMALFAIVRRLPRTWQFWCAGAAILITMIGALIFPVFLAPMFNQ